MRKYSSGHSILLRMIEEHNAEQQRVVARDVELDMAEQDLADKIGITIPVRRVVPNPEVSDDEGDEILPVQEGQEGVDSTRRPNNNSYVYCQRPGCGRENPPERRKYCSGECSKIINRKSAAERSRLRAEEYRRQKLANYSPRTCIIKRCELNKTDPPGTFQSEGPWNRICPACRSKGYGHTNYARNEAGSSPVDSRTMEEEVEPEDVGKLPTGR